MAQYKRLGGIMAITLAATTGLTACGFGGSTGEATGDGTTLDLLVPSYSDATQGLWDDVIAGFEEENPDIDVNLQVESWDNLESVIATKIQGGDAPDIYNGGPFAGFAEDELLYPVEDVTSDETYADFQPTFVWVNPDFAAEEPDLVTGFVAGMMQGCRDLWADDWDSDENLAIINGYTNVEAALIREASRTWCHPNGTVNIDDLETLQAFFGDRGLLEYDEPLDIESLIDTSYVEAALEEIGESDLQ